MELYYSDTLNSLRALMALEELALPYEPRRLDLNREEQHEEWFRDLNPLGLVPLLIDRSASVDQPLILSQSGAILLHLVTQECGLLPRAPAARAKALEWCMHGVSDLSPLNATMKYLKRDLGVDAEDSVSYLFARLLRFLGVAERTLRASGSGYLQDDFGLAELGVFPVAHHHFETLLQTARYPALCRWITRVESRPSVKRALSRLNDANGAPAPMKALSTIVEPLGKAE
jgi:GST-like protein